MGKTVVHGQFEWDEDKNTYNISEHKISFEEILPMFDDPLFWEQYDVGHSTLEETRYFGTAKIYGFVVVVCSYTECGRTRIISARISTPEEEDNYEKWCKQFYS
ncbi:MAG: BrnT family toxin [Treponema sp.]|jgi:uncharacterized DUF497 family protein|nr:BrnT family toxin [Treponema sp.]